MPHCLCYKTSKHQQSHASAAEESGIDSDFFVQCIWILSYNALYFLTENCISLFIHLSLFLLLIFYINVSYCILISNRINRVFSNSKLTLAQLVKLAK